MKIERNSTDPEIDSSIKKAERHVVLRSIVIGIASVLFFGLLTLFVYRAPRSNPIARVAIILVSFPAAMVNGSMISLNEYEIKHDAVAHYFHSTGLPIPDEENLRQSILDALVFQAVVKRLAADAGVHLDHARVDVYEQDTVKFWVRGTLFSSLEYVKIWLFN